MAATLVHSELNYENKWISFRETAADSGSHRVLHKEVRHEFIRSAESWKKERYLKNLLDTMLHLEELPLDQTGLSHKDYKLPGGSSLMHLILENQMTMPERLKIATDILQITLELHNKGHLFCDLNPYLFWCDLIEEKTYLVDTIMTVHAKDVEEFYSTIMGIDPHMLCLSPDQSIQTTSIPDFRSNYYSLGIILYALFTGRFPLESSDRISTIHKHLSQLPPDPRSVNMQISRSMGSFILKLLSKDPKDRYQSPAGLLFDFRKCKSLQLKNDIEGVFELATKDFPTQFNIPDSVFLRKEAHETLLALSNRVANGEKHLAVLKGEEGSGASFLVNAFFKDLNYDQFFIGSGVYSPRDSIPFKGLKDLTSDLLHQILMEDPVFISELKASMEKSIANLSGVLIEFEKDFRHLFDSREVPDDLIGIAAINRFIYAYSEFLRLLGLRGKYLIISLERFELADIGTTRLIAQLLKSSVIQNILILIAVNKDENTYNSSCIEFLEGLPRNFDGPEPVAISAIALDNYDHPRINHILESLKIEPLKAFGKMVFEKTRGNLSFIKQLFEELIAQDYIKANSGKKIWEVDIHAVQNIDLSDNVRDFLKNRVTQLSSEELHVLKGAVTMGQHIDVRQLHHILSFDKEEVDTYINNLRHKGFLLPVEYENARLSKVKFSHSGFSEILLDAIEPEELERFKLDQVKVLITELNEDQVTSRIYELTAHLMPLRPESCVDYIPYLEKAAYKAKSEAAFDNASQYFTKLFAIEKVHGTDQELIFTHVYEATLCALYAMKYTTYQSLLRQLERVVGTKNQGYRIYHIKAMETLQRGNHSATLQVLEEGLRAMGVSFNLTIGKAEMIKLFLLNLWNSRKLNSGNVEDLPYNRDEKQAIYHELINISAPAVYFLKPELVARMTYLGIRDTMKNGLIGQSPYNLIALGFTLNSFSNMVARSHEICRAGFKLLEQKVSSKEVAIPANFLYSAFVQHTEFPLKVCIASLEEYYKRGRELGNINIAYYCLGMNRWYLLFSGHPLPRLAELVDASHKLCLNDNQKLIDGFHILIKTLVQELTRGYFFKEALEDPDLPLGRDAFSDEEIIGDRILLANLQLVKLIVDSGNNKVCEDQAFLGSLLTSVKEGGHGSLNAIYHIFYGLMHLFRGKLRLAGITKSQINKLLGIVRVRSEIAPFTYKVKYLLLLGLKAEMKGKSAIAKNQFAEAYSFALEFHNPWDKALCCELYGAHLIAHGLKRAGLQKMAEAVEAYTDWGASSIVHRILHQFPELSEMTNAGAGDSITTQSAEQVGSNLQQLIRLGSSVYGEDDLRTLVKTLVDAISAEASVEKAVFIIKNELHFTIYASWEPGQEMRILNSNADASSLPLTVLRLVERRKTLLVLGDACQNPQYRSDPYIRENETKSLLCIPFVRGHQTKSLIYLENSQHANVFEAANIDLINLMYAQVAVAMDNFTLTESLEDTLKHRSLQITLEKDKADNLIKNILPAHVAEELKVSGKVKARKYDNVSVLFTDFKDFSLFSEKLTADQIIDELDRCFKAFDTITEEFGLEKIKTIGDAYMCAGGISDDHPSHEYDIVNAGLKMLAYIEESNKDRVSRGIPALHLREGIHTGPLIAGVVGSKKYAFDIWGPTVNIASRMESSGEPGMLNISGTLYLKVKDQFSCKYRGKIFAKNVGEIDMYFVEKKR